MAVGDSGNEVRAQVVLPAVDAERCVHGALPNASCRACVAVCPLGAFALDEDGLSLDTQACDGCGLCAGVCPQEAIDLDARMQPLLRPSGGVSTVFLACDRVAAVGEPGQVACVHGVSLSAVARCHAKGAQVFALARGECRDCPRNTAATIDDRVAQVSRLATDRGLPVMRVRECAIAVWRQERDEAAHMSRRSLFRAALKPTVAHAPPASALQPGAPAGVIVARRDAARVALMVPVIDRKACTACGACVEVCPHRVLSLKTTDQGAAYEIDATACTGCGICVDACDVGAVALQAWGPAHPQPVPLARGHCRHCGVTFHRVADEGGEGVPAGQQLCPICAKHPHHKSLYQVLP